MEAQPSSSAPIISVVGDAEIHEPAERGTVRLTVGFEGPERTRVVRDTEALHAEIVEGLRAIHDGERGPVTWWSSDRIRVWAHRPWNNQGKQLPLVYKTAVSFTAKFSDFARLTAWIGEVSVRTGVTIDGVDWALTEARRVRLTEEVRRRAVRAAVEKATVYAQSLGLSHVSPVALGDPGLLSETTTIPAPGMAAMSARGAVPGGSGDPLALKPEDITLHATVHARFAAS